MRKERRALRLLLCLALALGLVLALGASAWADDFSFIDRWWDGSSVREKDDYVNVYSTINEDTRTISGWYVVNGYFEFSQRLTVSGTANIVIVDGSTLYLEDGICVNAGNTLNIYGQRDGSGTLKRGADTNNNAAIGSDEGNNCGTINIYGATVIADAYDAGDDAAGIGGGLNGNGGTITIYGGNVTAKGANYSADGGAGIGGGQNGNCGTVTIYGGTVNAEGGKDGAGIGSGDKASGGTIEIYGGNVTAQGGGDAAGIGSGDEGYGATITFHGGTVNATGGGYGAGIGGGDADNDGRDAGTITILGGNVTAQGGTDSAGIGGGEGCGAGTIEIHGGTINATGGSDERDGGAGIGSGDKDGRSMGVSIIRIYGGDITANGGPQGAGIGGGDGCDGGTIEIYGGTVTANGKRGTAGLVYLNGSAGIGGGAEGDSGTIWIGGGHVTATGGRNGAGIGGGAEGFGDNITITGDAYVKASEEVNAAGIGSGAEVYDWGTINITGGTVITEGTSGIGGGSGNSSDYNIPGGTINISNATVEAHGASGAGIGGGRFCNGGHITIKNSTVTADSSGSGAGIGGGNNGDGGTIEIIDSTVTAIGKPYSTGIGGGYEANGGDVTIVRSTVTAISDTAEYQDPSHRGAAIGAAYHHDEEDNPVNHGTLTIDGEASVLAGDGEASATLVDTNAYLNNHAQHYAKITNLFAVTYDANGATGGSVPTDSGIYEREAGVTVLGNTGSLEKSLFTFGGWNTKPDGTGTSYQPGESFTITENTTLYAKWDAVPVSYMDWDGSALVERTGDEACRSFELVTAGTTAFESGRWYAVSGSVSVDERISVSGTAHLIVTDGATLEAKQGITVAEGASLILHGQSGGTGTLTANGNDFAAGIGGTRSTVGGSVTVNGCNVTAVGGKGGAGIGGGWEGVGGTVTVNGGTVTATGGLCSSGIGGGYDREGGSFTINGGIVVASGGEGGTGIGAGCEDSYIVRAGGGTVTINSGMLTAIGSNNAPGIGGGMNGGSDTITFNGGTVTVSGGFRAAAIGAGENGTGGEVSFNGSIVHIQTDGQKAVEASSVSFNDVPQYVSYKKYGSGDVNVVFDDERISALTNLLDTEYIDVLRGERYTVTYDANGGTAAPESQTGLPGEQIQLSTQKPEHEDSVIDLVTTLDPNGGTLDGETTLHSTETTTYTFKNWNTAADGSGTSYDPGASYTDSASVTLYAQWVPVSSRGKVFLPEPTREGYTYNGWSIDPAADHGAKDEYEPTDSRTLYATWTINQYTITFDTDGGTEIAPITQDYGAAITPPADPVKEEYIFTGWEPALPATMPAQDITVKAMYKLAHPMITGADLVLGGTLDLRFYLQVPEDFDPTDSYMSISIGGRNARSIICEYAEGLDVDGKRVFSFPVYSIEMAEPVSAVFHYGTEEATLTASVKDYLEKLEADGGQDAIIAAVRNYGHYMQPYLAAIHGFTVGEGEGYDYEAMPAAGEITPLTELEAYRRVWGENAYDANVLKSMSYYDTFNESTTLNIRLRFKAVPGTVTATVDGGAWDINPRGDKVYQLEIRNIAANALGTPMHVVVTADGKIVYDVHISALSYVSAVLASNRDQAGEREALTAFYEYFEAAKAYGQQ